MEHISGRKKCDLQHHVQTIMGKNRLVGETCQDREIPRAKKADNGRENLYSKTGETK